MNVALFLLDSTGLKEAQLPASIWNSTFNLPLIAMYTTMHLQKQDKKAFQLNRIYLSSMVYMYKIWNKFEYVRRGIPVQWCQRWTGLNKARGPLWTDIMTGRQTWLIRLCSCIVRKIYAKFLYCILRLLCFQNN